MGCITNSNAIVSTGLTSGTGTLITTIALTPGIYIINYQIQYNISGAPTISQVSTYLNNTNTNAIGSNTVSIIQYIYNITSANPLYLSNSTILNVASSTTFYLYAYLLFTGNVQYIDTNSFLRAVRIG